MNQKVTLQQDWVEAEKVLKDAQKILLSTHINPDPDAIGSMLGLYLALIDQAKEVVMVVDGKVPPDLMFLKGADSILSEIPQAYEPDLIVSLDGDDLAVLGDCGSKAFSFDVPKLVVDHHAYNELYGTVHIVNSEYVSTTEALVELMEFLQWPLTADIAQPLLLGMMSDTQVFRVSKVKARTFELAQKLISHGVDYRELIERVFSTIDSGQLQLKGHILSRSTLEDNVCWTWVLPEDYVQFGMKDVARVYVIDELIQDREAYVAATFKVKENGMIKVSMRAIPGFDVGQLANSLGGGGHVLAAGCRIKSDDLKMAINKVIPLLKKEARRGKPQYM